MGLSYLIPTKFHGDPLKFMSGKKPLILSHLHQQGDLHFAEECHYMMKEELHFCFVWQKSGQFCRKHDFFSPIVVWKKG